MKTSTESAVDLLRKSAKTKVGATVLGLSVVTALVAPISIASAASFEESCSHAYIIGGVINPDIKTDNDIIADSCDFEQSKYETFLGTPRLLDTNYTNCDGGFEGGNVTLRFNVSIDQGSGTFKFTDYGGAGLLGAINGSWTAHEGTMKMTNENVTFINASTTQLPKGKTVKAKFTPRMARMTGRWHAVGGEYKGSKPWEEYKDDVITGPLTLPTGMADGEVEFVFSDCPGNAPDPAPTPSASPDGQTQAPPPPPTDPGSNF